MKPSDVKLDRIVYLQPGNVPCKILMEQIINGTLIVEIPNHLLRLPRPGEPTDDGLREVDIRYLTLEKGGLPAVVAEAHYIIDCQAIGEEADAGFDGGEFSRPAHADILEGLLRKLAFKHNVSYDKLRVELMKEGV